MHRSTFTGKWCGKWAIKGGTVCDKHGGNAPQVKKAAQRRLEQMLLRKVDRLHEISEQNIHMPSALGATQAIINRVMGKVGEAERKDRDAPIIQIGVAFTQGDRPSIAVAQLPARGNSASPDTIEADYDKPGED